MANSKIKIFFLDHTPFIGGAQISLCEHLNILDKEKFEPIIVCSEKARELGLLDVYSKMNIRYHIISFGQLKKINFIIFLRLMYSVKELFSLIKKEKPDLIFCNTIRANIIGSICALLTGIKILWFIQDFTFPLYLFRMINFIPKKIFYVSLAVTDYYKVKINKKNKILHIWRNTHQAVKKISTEEISKIKKELSINGVFVIGFIGRLVHWKGPQVLINAVNILLKRGFNNFKVLIIGSGKGQEGDNERYLKKLCDNNHLNNKITFIGFKDDIILFMKCLDVLCLTSIEPEPYSSVIVEAMMAKVLVIGTNIGGMPEIIKQNETGLLVDPNNSSQLADAIIRLYKDNILAQELATQAYNNVIKNNTAEIKTEFLQKEYEECVKAIL